MQIHYLEIVTPKADDLCKQYSAVHGVTFAAPDPNLGGARTAKLKGGGILGIRGPLRDTENPVIRPYALVDDIKAAVAEAAKAGAEVALPPMKLEGHGTCAIVIQGASNVGFGKCNAKLTPDRGRQPDKTRCRCTSLTGRSNRHGASLWQACRSSSQAG